MLLRTTGKDNFWSWGQTIYDQGWTKSQRYKYWFIKDCSGEVHVKINEFKLGLGQTEVASRLEEN